MTSREANHEKTNGFGDVLGVVVVEDETPARRTITSVLAMDPELDLLAETWGVAAPEVIRRKQPDLILLDIQMPGLNGFDILDAIGPDLPVTIMVTAHDSYAVRAFEVRAIDYVLKPFTDERLQEALSRAKDIVRQGRRAQAARRILGLLETRSDTEALALPVRSSRGRVVIVDGARKVVFDPADIRWIEAEGPYARIHRSGRSILVRTSLTELTRRLDPEGFFRIHRSAVVNMSWVAEVKPLTHGDHLVVLTDGTELKLSRSRREAFDRHLLD